MKMTKELVYRSIGTILKIGFYLSFGLLLIGVVLNFIQPTSYANIFSPLSFVSLLNFDSLPILNLGIIVLIFTPLLRVLVALVSFWLEKDKKYSLVALGVFIILILGILIAQR